MRIIIVDNHLLFREGIASIFRSEPDIEIVGLAGTVNEAVELAQSTRPEIVLMDLIFSDGTGVEATRRILEKQPECKVVFLATYAENNHLFDAIRAGAKGYLLKDILPCKLIAALRSVHNGECALSRSMTLRVMEELARIPDLKPPEKPKVELLTDRELEVLEKIAAGKVNQEIAKEFYLSENTVKNHVHAILKKLGMSDRKEAAKFAWEHGLFEKTTYLGSVRLGYRR